MPARHSFGRGTFAVLFPIKFHLFSSRSKAQFRIIPSIELTGLKVFSIVAGPVAGTRKNQRDVTIVILFQYPDKVYLKEPFSQVIPVMIAFFIFNSLLFLLLLLAHHQPLYKIQHLLSLPNLE